MQRKINSIEEGLDHLVDSFIENRLREIQSLTQSLNLSDIKLKAHSWKGYSRPYGFPELERIAIELQKQANEENKEACEKLLKKASLYMSSF